MSMFGWVPMPEEVDRFCQDLRTAHGADTFWGAKSELRDHHKTKPHAFMWTAEVTLFGKTLPEWDQKRGTCAAQSSTRGFTDRTYRQRAFEKRMFRPVEWCFETNYGGGRVNIGNGQCGYADAYGHNDGCSLVWIMKLAHDVGLCPRGVHGQYDLTKPREDLAVQWGQPGVGIPHDLISVCNQYRVQQVHHCQSALEVADCLAAGYACAVASNQGFTTTRDARGMCQASGNWSHAMEVRGYFMDDRGQLCFVIQQSWGSAHSPNGPDHVFLQGGQQIQLPEGAFGCDLQTFDSMVRSGGDTWAIGYVPGIPE